MRKTIDIIEDLDKGINMEQLAPNPNVKEEDKDGSRSQSNGTNTGTNE